MSVMVDVSLKKLLARTDAAARKAEHEARGDGKEVIRLCEYQRANGERCRMLAVQDRQLCARHLHWYQNLPTYMVLPYPEDALSLQEIAARAVAMTMARVIDARAALAIAALCRTMRRNLPDVRRELEREEWEREVIGVVTG